MNVVYKYNVPYTTNTVVFSSDNRQCIENYKNNVEHLDADDQLRYIAEDVYEGLCKVTDTKYVLTDDLAPVEVLGQKVLNDIVEDSLQYFKEELENSGNGIKDIFKLISG